MKSIKAIKITTAKQFEKMVELLEQKPELAQSYHSGLKKLNTKEEWKEISNKLNSLGPPFRTGPEWLKVWADYKSNLKKKILHNKTECRATGDGLNKQFTLSAVEEAASALLQLSSLINPDGEEIGISNTSFEEPIYISCGPESEEIVASTSKDKVVNKKLRKESSVKNDLIEQQLKVQTDLYNEVKDSLKQIERYGRKQLKVHEESLSLYKSEIKIKKEKFELYKKELKKKNEQEKLLLQLKADEIEIKRRKIGIGTI